MAANQLITGVSFAVRDASRPLLVVGPSLGTSATSLWERAVAPLLPSVDVIGWDLPGHGTSPHRDAPWVAGDVSIATLAAAVLDVVAEAQRTRGDEGAPFWYAGVSAGGAVGLQLALDAPDRLSGLVMLCSAATFGDPQFWLDRADLVERAGTPTQVTGAAERWFGRGFMDREPSVAGGLLGALQTTDPFGYAAVCRALAEYDVTDRLGEVAVAVTVVAGGDDKALGIESAAVVANEVPHGDFVLLQHVGHQAPAEAHCEVTELLSARIAGDAGTDAHAAGMKVRREVLGDAHVDRAIASTTPFTQDFQDLITRYPWAEIWTRPGLDRRTRSAVTISVLVARGHWDELAMHIRAARRNGLSNDEIGEILLQLAVYASVPSANQAFHIAQQVLAEDQGDA